MESRFRDFLELTLPGCEHFHWREVLWHHRWKVFVFPDDRQRKNLIDICKRAELVRKILNCPLHVTSALRAGTYNNYINGATYSMHKVGGALDFVPQGFKSIDAMAQARKMIEPHLDSIGIRMERLPRANWIHIDNKDPGPQGNRYFVP